VPKAPHPVLRKLGVRIRTLRAAKHWSQEELAHVAGIDRSYMSGVERGIRNVSVLNLTRIAKALGTSLSDLFRSLP